MAINLSLYSFVFAMFAFWSYSLMQPKLIPDPGMRAIKPPGTVISLRGTRSIACPARAAAEALSELPPTPEADETVGRSVQTLEQAAASRNRPSKQED